MGALQFMITQLDAFDWLFAVRDVISTIDKDKIGGTLMKKQLNMSVGLHLDLWQAFFVATKLQPHFSPHAHEVQDTHQEALQHDCNSQKEFLSTSMCTLRISFS